MTYEEMMKYCSSHREPDGFCSLCSGCSGPSYSNMAVDFERPLPQGVRVYRGGTYGSCRFEVLESE